MAQELNSFSGLRREPDVARAARVLTPRGGAGEIDLVVQNDSRKGGGKARDNPCIGGTGRRASIDDDQCEIGLRDRRPGGSISDWLARAVGSARPRVAATMKGISGVFRVLPTASAVR